MPLYAYERADLSGNRSHGTVYAEDNASDDDEYAEAYTEAAKGGFTVTNLYSTATPIGYFNGFLHNLRDSKKKQAKSLINWWKLYRVHVRDGADKLALRTYIPHCPSRKVKQALEGVLSGMHEHGQNLLQALGKYPTVFDPAYVAMLETASKAGTMIATINVIIETEATKLRGAGSTIIDRLDAYVTYGVTAISLVVISRSVIPGLTQQAKDAHMTDNVAVAAVQALGVAGDLIMNPFFYIALIPVMLIVQWFVYQSPLANDIGRFIEEWRWKIPPLKEHDLTVNRTRTLRIINDAHNVNLSTARTFEFAVGAASSHLFATALRNQRDAIETGNMTLEQSIAANPLWGQEICSYFASRKGGGWHGDVQDMLRTLSEEEDQNRRLASYAGTSLHVLTALVLTGVVTLLVTIAQFAVLIGAARQPI